MSATTRTPVHPHDPPHHRRGQRASRVATAATAGLAGLALGLTGSLAAPAQAAPTQTTAAIASAERAALVRTEFAFKANGYGTSASGGQVPVGSDRTALSSIACTSDAGKSNRNFVAESEVPGLGTVRGVYSRLATSQKKGVTASTSGRATPAPR